ncbi:MAG TPA: carboxypeptidase-like regulatory domain-containing protein [Planctomycetota bacterium]|jgi:hypothetical protein|nr:carboxypeptidase-like regulatory domain-containing protein [Planctomycetota bacterium]
MKRLLALAAVLGLAVGYVLMRTSTPPATESAPVETRESVEAVAPPQLDAPESVPLDRMAPPPEIAPPERSAPSTRAPIVLTGRLTNASGKEFRTLRGQVRITDARGVDRMAPIQGDTYSVDGVAPGTIDIGVEASGFRRVARAVTLEAHETERREDFALDPVWTIAVRFVTTDRGERLDREPPMSAKFWAVATEAPPGERLPPELAEVVGRKHWAPSELSDRGNVGILDVGGKPPTYVSAVLSDVVVATKLVETPVETLVIEIDLERLQTIYCDVQGTVVDATTLGAVPGATVMLHGPSRELPVTNGAGAFSATRMLPGDYTISIETAGHAHEIRRARLAPGRVNDLGAIPLESPVPLRGRFVDPQGRPAQAEGNLTPYEPQSNLGFSRTAIGIQADASGRFESTECARRLYLLRVTGGDSRWCGRPMLVDLREGAIDDVVVPVHVAVELILRPLTDDVRQHRYTIVTTDGLRLYTRPFRDSGVDRQTLAPGSYKLLLGEEASIVREIPFTLGEQPMTLDVGL